jgi:hypothetical protein
MSVNTFVQWNIGNSFPISYRWGSHNALRGDGVPMANVRAGLIAPTTRACAVVELLLCVRIIAREVLIP